MAANRHPGLSAALSGGGHKTPRKSWPETYWQEWIYSVYWRQGVGNGG